MYSPPPLTADAYGLSRRSTSPVRRNETPYGTEMRSDDGTTYALQSPTRKEYEYRAPDGREYVHEVAETTPNSHSFSHNSSSFYSSDPTKTPEQIKYELDRTMADMQARMAETFASVGGAFGGPAAFGANSQISNLMQHHSDTIRRLVETHPASLHTELNRLSQQFHDDLNRTLGVASPPPVTFPQHSYYNAAAPPGSLLPPPRAMTPPPMGNSPNNSYVGTSGTYYGGGGGGGVPPSPAASVANYHDGYYANWDAHFRQLEANLNATINALRAQSM